MTKLPRATDDGFDTDQYRTATDQAIEDESSAMAHKDKLIQQTLELWQPRTSRQLTEEDARQMIDNAVGVFRLLLKWHQEELMTETSVEPSKGEQPE